MSLQTLTLESVPVDVTLSKSGTRLAVLSALDIAVYALDMHKRPIPKPVLLWRSNALKGYSPRQVAFVGDEDIHILIDNWDEEEAFLWRSEGENVVPHGPIMETENVSSLVSSVGSSAIYAQFKNGSLHQVDTTANMSPQTPLIQKLPSFCSETQVAEIEGQVWH